MNTTTDLSAQCASALLEAVGSDEQALCYVPGRRPVSLALALEWLGDSVSDGYLTDFRVSHEQRGAIVWLKRWLKGEDEPDWPEDWPSQDETESGSG